MIWKKGGCMMVIIVPMVGFLGVIYIGYYLIELTKVIIGYL